jgi:hypothetical protein
MYQEVVAREPAVTEEAEAFAWVSKKCIGICAHRIPWGGVYTCVEAIVLPLLCCISGAGRSACLKCHLLGEVVCSRVRTRGTSVASKPESGSIPIMPMPSKDAISPLAPNRSKASLFAVAAPER